MVKLIKMVPVHHAHVAVVDVDPQKYVMSVIQRNSCIMESVLILVPMELIQLLLLLVILANHATINARLVMPLKHA